MARQSAPVPPPMHAMLVRTFVPMLGTLGDLLQKGRAHAISDGRDPDVLFGATLAPGMYGLGAQVRVACDHALESSARIAGVDRPRHAPSADTIDDLLAEIGSTIAFLERLPEAPFASERIVTLPLEGDLVLEMDVARFVRDWALPLFSFHVVLAYGILRHEGVEIGVRDYLAHIADAIRSGDARP